MRDSEPCLFRREHKGKEIKISVFPPNLSTLGDIVIRWVLEVGRVVVHFFECLCICIVFGNLVLF